MVESNAIKNNKNMLPSYTIGEEIFNSVTHGIGVLMSIAFMIMLIIKFRENTSMVISSIVYSICLMNMYLSSTLYHAITNKKAKSILRYFDHRAIFLCIAGTYTPMLVRSFTGTIRISLLILIWGLCYIGIGIKLYAFLKKKVKALEKLSLFLYIMIGWISLFLLKEIIAQMGLLSFWLIFAGGVLYSVGVVFYKKKGIKYFHSIWHIFIMLASICQFLALFLS